MENLTIAHLGAGAFGAVIGWLTFFVNRYRTGAIALGDLTTIIGIFAGAGVTAVFNDTLLFGAYGLGLAAGFFAYLALLAWLVHISEGYKFAWFLDGRRPKVADDEEIPATARETAAPFKDAVAIFSGTPSTARADIADDKSASIESLKAAADDLLQKAKALPHNDPERDKLMLRIDEMNDRIDSIMLAQINATLDGKDLREARDIIRSTTKNLKDEAKRMKSATKSLTQAGKVLGAADQLIAELRKVA